MSTHAHTRKRGKKTHGLWKKWFSETVLKDPIIVFICVPLLYFGWTLARIGDRLGRLYLNTKFSTLQIGDCYNSGIRRTESRFRYPFLSDIPKCISVQNKHTCHVLFKLAPIYYSQWRRAMQKRHIHTQIHDSLPSHSGHHTATHSILLLFLSIFLSLLYAVYEHAIWCSPCPSAILSTVHYWLR